MRRVCLIASFAFALLKAHGVVPAATEFPFEFREGLLWIKASVSQSDEPLNLLVDTGAGVSVMNASTAERLKLGLGRAVTVHGVGTTVSGHWVKGMSATAGGVQLPAKFLAVDLNQLSKSCARRVDGLLGADFFRDRVVQIDF